MELNLLLRQIIWMAFIVVILVISIDYYEDEQLQKGKAIAHYLEENHGKVVPAAEARFLILEVTEYNIDLGNIDIFQK